MSWLSLVFQALHMCSRSV